MAPTVNLEDQLESGWSGSVDKKERPHAGRELLIDIILPRPRCLPFAIHHSPFAPLFVSIPTWFDLFWRVANGEWRVVNVDNQFFSSTADCFRKPDCFFF
ncbi:MAG: hypothetical protein KatS3mg112_0789 [Thermogutta sp.]|nr:MAG: hypothetical protein KatS3mg112_0789 [Thermogutta sp.]